MLLACVSAVVGCATGQRIELAYAMVPTEGVTQALDISVHVAEFEDRRTDLEVVGEIQRGFWGSVLRPDTKIRPREGTARAWVRDALVEELKLRGYKVVAADDKPQWQVLGRVLELNYSEGGWLVTRPGAVITVECELVRNDKIVLVEQYWNSATASDRPGDPAHLLETVLRRNLRKFIGDFDAQREGVATNG